MEQKSLLCKPQQNSCLSGWLTATYYSFCITLYDTLIETYSSLDLVMVFFLTHPLYEFLICNSSCSIKVHGQCKMHVVINIEYFLLSFPPCVNVTTIRELLILEFLAWKMKLSWHLRIGVLTLEGQQNMSITRVPDKSHLVLTFFSSPRPKAVQIQQSWLENP